MRYDGYMDAMVEWMSSAYMVQRYKGCVESTVSGRAWAGRPDLGLCAILHRGCAGLFCRGWTYYQDSTQNAVAYVADVPMVPAGTVHKVAVPCHAP